VVVFVERFLKDMFGAAVASGRPSVFMPRAISDLCLSGPVTIVGAGKAATGMAEVSEALLDVRSGVIVTKYGQAATCRLRKTVVLEASHPIPDEASARAAVRILETARACGRDATLLCLLSGGGSALMSLPVEGVARHEKAALVRGMLDAGLPIAEINCVRRHLSAVKGGRLARAAWPARVVTLAVSDVVGDDPATIASGPTVPDDTTLADARAVLEIRGIEITPSIAAALGDPRNETPFSSDPVFESCVYKIAACGEDALSAAALVAMKEGWEVLNAGASVSGDSIAAAADFARQVRQLRASGRRCVVISGGETTSVVRGPGRGGSNTEFLLALAIELQDMRGVWAIAADTDGIDGSGDHAGAWFGPDILAAIGEAGESAIGCLEQSNSATLFDSVGGLIRTGQTGTNVNDFRAIVIV